MADGEEQISLIPIFISYRWNETKDDVRQFAEYLKSLNRFDVWIDTQEMYGDKNERMEEGIRKSRIVLIFFNDDYQKSRDCRKEAESADRNGKDIVFVKMQLSKCPLLSWFAPIISSNIFVDFYKFQNPTAEILKHIDKLLVNNQTSMRPLQNTSGRVSSKLVTVKVPKFGKYQNRPADERNILEAVQKLCEDSETFQGPLVICGGGGTGKTTLVAQLVLTQGDFLCNSCSLNAAVWLNCFKWTGEDAFDEGEFVRSLVELAEKAGEFTAGGSRKLEDICTQFERQNERLLVILDDVFNVRILETMHEHCTSGSLVCFAVTRDVDLLTSTHGLVSDTYRLNELDDDTLISMFEKAYRLEGKLNREQLSNLAKQCSGLPIVVSLIAARFQDCETIRDFAAEYETVFQSVKVKDLKIAGPYGTVSKLFAFSLEQQDDAFRKMYYAFLLFDPAHPVDVEDLAILWQCSNQHRALVQCRQLAKKSLARPVIGTSPNANNSDFYLIHQLLHEAAADNAIKTHKLAENLADLRTKIACRFGDVENALTDIINQAVVNERRYILETIFDQVDLKCLLESCRKRSELTENCPFLLYLYNFKWHDNGPPIPFGINHSYRLLLRLFRRVENSPAISNKQVIDVLKEADNKGNSLILQLFSEHYIQEYWSDRWRVADVLKPMGVYGVFKQIDWLRNVMAAKDANTELFLAAATSSDPELVSRLAREKATDVLARNAAGEIPLMAAARFGNLDVIKLLIDLAPESVNSVNNSEQNALTIAAYNGCLEAVKFLYDRTQNALTCIDTKGRSPTILAASNGCLEVVKFLYDRDKGSITDADRDSRTPLIVACRYGYFDIVEFLLNVSPNPAELLQNADMNGMTPFQFAAANGHLDIVKYLSNPSTTGTSGVNQHLAVDKHGTNAFLMAARKGHIHILEYLYERGDKLAIEGRQKAGKTALILAAERNHLNVVQFMYEKIKNPHEFARLQESHGNNAMILAARYGHLDVVRFLYDCDNSPTRLRDIFVTFFNNSNDTSLSIAVRFGHLEVVKFLTEKLLTDVNTQPSNDINEIRQTTINKALDIARKNKLDNIAEFLAAAN